MRPPTRSSVRHQPSALQPQAVEGAARLGAAGMPAPIQSLEDGQPRAPPPSCPFRSDTTPLPLFPLPPKLVLWRLGLERKAGVEEGLQP